MGTVTDDSVSGSGTPGNTVELRDGDGTPLDEQTIGDDGTWTFEDLQPDTEYSVVEKGSDGAESDPVEFTTPAEDAEPVPAPPADGDDGNGTDGDDGAGDDGAGDDGAGNDSGDNDAAGNGSDGAGADGAGDDGAGNDATGGNGADHGAAADGSDGDSSDGRDAGDNASGGSDVSDDASADQGDATNGKSSSNADGKNAGTVTPAVKPADGSLSPTGGDMALPIGAFAAALLAGGAALFGIRRRSRR